MLNTSSDLLSVEVRDAITRIKGETDVVAKARLLHFLKRDWKMRIKDMARELDMKPSYICNVLRIVRLPDIVIDGYMAQNLTAGHLIVLSRLKDHEHIVSIYEKVLTGSLTVARTEELVREALYDTKSVGERVPQEVIRAIGESYESLDPDIKVRVMQTRIRARIKIEMKGDLKKTTSLLTRLANQLSGKW